MLSWANSPAAWRREQAVCVVDGVGDVSADSGGAEFSRGGGRSGLRSRRFWLSSSRMRSWARVSRCRSEASDACSVGWVADLPGAAIVVSRRGWSRSSGCA